MKKLKLTTGEIALISNIDYKKVSKKNWYYIKRKDNKKSYIVSSAYKKNKSNRILLHHFILEIKSSRNYCVDHKNGNIFDNRRKNLRIATYSQNNCNKNKMSHRSGKALTSKYKGVSWDKYELKWRPVVYYKGKKYSFGYFKSERKAALAYNKMAKKIHGKFARINK